MASEGGNEPLRPIYHLSPPPGAITDDNHGGYVVISGWILMCFFVVCVATRLATRYSYVLAGGIDDILIGVAMVFGIAQTAVIHRSASIGLGQHQDALPESSFETYAKNYYYGNILFILALLFSKISAIFLLTRLAPKPNTRRSCQIVGTFFTIWALATVLSSAFQCQLPRPWDYRENASHRCPVNGAVLNYSIMVFDILTDIACIVIPITMLWNLQMATQRRWTLIGAFACRIFVCVCSAIRISTLVTYYNTSDKSWEAVGPQTWAQVVQCLSIMTACIPSLKVFLGSLESGFMDMSMRMHGGPTYRTEYASGSGKHGTAYRTGNASKQNANNSFALASFPKEGTMRQDGTETIQDVGSFDSAERAGSLTESTTHLRQEPSPYDGGITVTREVDICEVNHVDRGDERDRGDRPQYFHYGK